MTADRGQRTEGRGQRTEGGGQRTVDGIQKSHRRHPSSVVCPLLLVVLIFFAGCGKKSPPFLSQRKDVTVRVDQLEGAWQDKTLVLKGLVQGDAALVRTITGCRVYYVWYPQDRPPCEGCPIDMTRFRDITDQRITDGRFECRFPAFREKGICFLMVRIMEKVGLLGPESSRIKLISDR